MPASFTSNKIEDDHCHFMAEANHHTVKGQLTFLECIFHPV